MYKPSILFRVPESRSWLCLNINNPLLWKRTKHPSSHNCPTDNRDSLANCGYIKDLRVMSGMESVIVLVWTLCKGQRYSSSIASVNWLRRACSTAWHSLYWRRRLSCAIFWIAISPAVNGGATGAGAPRKTGPGGIGWGWDWHFLDQQEVQLQWNLEDY